MAVHAVIAERGRISKWVAGEGNALAVKKRNLLFETAGKVVLLGKGTDGRPLQEGSRVKGPAPGKGPGTLLAGLDNRQFLEEIKFTEAARTEARNELEMARRPWLIQARKNLEMARKRHTAAKSSMKKKPLPSVFSRTANPPTNSPCLKPGKPKPGSNGAAAHLKGVEARLDQARIHLENTSLHAPFDGIIARLNISVGDHADPSKVDFTDGATLLETSRITLIDPGQLEVTLNVPVFDGLHIKPVQKVVITWGSMDWNDPIHPIDEPDDEKGNGRISQLRPKFHSVSPMLNINGRTVRDQGQGRTKKAVVAPWHVRDLLD